MKMVSFFMIIGWLQLCASGVAQKVSLSFNQAPLELILKQIKSQTGFRYLCDDQLLAQSKPITINVRNIELPKALSICLQNQNLDFSIENEVIVVSSNNRINITDVLIPPFIVSGVIRDNEGQAIAGATVAVGNSTKASTITDNNGRFSISVNIGDIITVSSINFNSINITIKDNSPLTIGLVPSSSELDLVQVIAYGTTTKRLNTGNVTSIKSDDIARQPINNPILALAGRVPGLTVNQSNGIAGSNVTVRIQGQNSIGNGNNPFYVIDGVPFSSESFSNPAGAGLSSILNGGSPLALLNPNSIESIEVLKDADATAIYGSRAANGAILITTKKGKSGATKVDFNIQNGVGEISNKIKLLNTEQYLELRNEAYFVNDKLTTSSTRYATQFDINGTWDKNSFTDWQDVLIGGRSHYQDNQASVSGGNTNTQFLIGGNYHKETSVFPGDLANRKSSVQVNLNHRSINNKFKAQLSANYLNDINELGSDDLTRDALQLAPNAPSLYNSDGGLNWAPRSNGSSSWTNPLRKNIRSYQITSFNLLSSAVVGYQILPELDLSCNFGYNKVQSSELIKEPLAYYRPEQRATNKSKVQNSEKKSDNWIIEPQFNFRKELSGHSISGLLGATFQSSDNRLLAIEGSGFADDSQLDNFKAAPSLRIYDAYHSEYKYQALFGRFGYNYQRKYVLNFSLRRDGTTRFGNENRYHSFYSIGTAWIFSEEDFLKSKNNFLSFGKLKMSYGTSGSDQVGDYNYLNLYSSTSVITPYAGGVGLLPNGLTNPYLAWEQTNKFNVGLDLGILNNRFMLEGNYFRNISNNQLVYTPLPSLAGFTYISQNIPAKILNDGLELSISADVIKKGRFNWSSRLNMTIPRNRLVEFPNLEDNEFYRTTLIVGQPLQILKRYRYGGINSETGLYQFVKEDGTLTSTPSSASDQTVAINLQQTLFGGFSNQISYKGVVLDFLFQFVKQRAQDYRAGVNTPGTIINQPIEVLNRWKDKESVNAAVQKVTSSSSSAFLNYQESDAAYTDASFIRLKNISLSWNIPIASGTIKSLRLFVLGQNLLTIKKYLGDVETKSFSNLPTLRTITAGINLSL